MVNDHIYEYQRMQMRTDLKDYFMDCLAFYAHLPTYSQIYDFLKLSFQYAQYRFHSRYLKSVSETATRLSSDAHNWHVGLVPDKENNEYFYRPSNLFIEFHFRRTTVCARVVRRDCVQNT